MDNFPDGERPPFPSRRAFLRRISGLIGATLAAPPGAVWAAPAVPTTAPSAASSARLWDREPTLWAAAQRVTLIQEIHPDIPPAGPMWKPTEADRTAPQYQGVYLGNPRLKVGLWGPPRQLTLSLRDITVWDRRTPPTQPRFPTLAEIRSGLFSPKNAGEENTPVPIHGLPGYLLPGGGRAENASWNTTFPIQKDTGQVLLLLPDFAATPSPAQAKIQCADGSARVELAASPARATVEYLTAMDNNVIAIHVTADGLKIPPALRLYRHRDTIPAIGHDEALEPPRARTEGRFFWIEQALPAERTYPGGFRYVLMGLIAGPGATVATVENQPDLGTPGGAIGPKAIGSAVTATLPAAAHHDFTAFLTVVTTADSDDPAAEGRKRLLAAESGGFEALRGRNADWHRRLYDRRENGRLFDGTPGRAEKIVPEIFRSWVFAHAPSSAPDPALYQCDSWNSALFDNDGGAWHGIPCYNEIYFGQFHVMNRSDQLAYYPRLVTQWLPACVKNAEAVFGLPGMFGPAHGYLPPINPAGPYPHSIFTWEFCMEIPAQVLKVGWDTFDYGGDERFLRESVYPPLRELAVFYAAYLRLGDDGLYHVFPTVSAEQWGWTYRGVRNRDGTAALAMFKWTLRRAAQAAGILNLDDDLRDGWSRMADKIAPYPTSPSPQGPVYTDIAGVDPLTVPLDNNTGYNFFGGVEPTVLADDINLDSDPATIQAMVRTATLVGGGDLHQSGWMNQAVYHLLGANPGLMHHHWPPMAWWVKVPPLPLTDLDRVMTAAFLEPDRLVNSRSGTLHLFPCLPDGVTLAFRRLQARGGFLVSAERIAGVTTWVLIESRRAVRCPVRNPWPGAKVRLVRNGTTAEELAGPLLEFTTRPGERIQLVKSEGV